MRVADLDVGQVLGQLPDAVVVADDGNRIVFANAAAHALLAYPDGALVGEPLTVIVPERLRDVHLAGFEHHVLTGEQRLLGRGPVHVPARRADGSEVEVELTLNIHETASGTLFTGSLRDRSRHLELEREQALNLALTAARTIELRLAVNASLTSVEQALPVVLEVAASVLEWDVAIGWPVQDRHLCAGPNWFSPGSAGAASAMSQRRIQRGVDLAGRVWHTGHAASLSDLQSADDVPRADVARRYGLTTGFAIPVSVDGEVVAVAEFFRTRPLSIGSASLVALSGAGQYVGVLLERAAATRRAEAVEQRTEAVIRAALDSIIRVDERGLITALNPAAERTLGWTAAEAVGQPMAELLIPERLRAMHYKGFARFMSTRVGSVIGSRLELPVLRADGTEFPSELTISADDVGGELHFTGFIRDLTEQTRAAEQARVTTARLEHIADTLQESLLPRALPVIAGMSLAARFRPAGSGDEIGGDFYDVFDYDDGRWCLVIGDVCGKGAEAAVLTALSRYTLRTAALEGHAPGQMLQLLNDALLAESTERFVTACVIVVQPEEEGWIVATSAAGGHPLPMVRRASGDVELIEVTGPLVGAFEEVDFPEVRFRLGLGDALVLYTDGVTEAAVDGCLLEDTGLVDLLGRSPRGACSESLADLIHRTVLGDGVGPSRDDVAILVASVVDRRA